MVVETAPKSQVFSFRMPLLSDGRSDTTLASTGALRIRGKVYAQGGENALHCHTNEDHVFIILDGEATFHDQDDNTTVVKRYEGILLPKGAYYWFQSTGDTNLVMARVGAILDPTAGNNRIDLQGKPLPGKSLENKTTPPVPIPGKFFGD